MKHSENKYSRNQFILTPGFSNLSFFFNYFFPLICKKITFSVHFHRFFLTIGLFLLFSVAKKWLEYTGFDCIYVLQETILRSVTSEWCPMGTNIISVSNSIIIALTPVPLCFVFCN